MAFSPSSDQLATASADSSLKIWDAKKLKPIKTLSGHQKYACDVAFSADGNLLQYCNICLLELKVESEKKESK